MQGVVRRYEVDGGPVTTPVLKVATYLPIRRYRDLFAFLRMNARITQQLKETPGLVRFQVRAQFFHRRFWTVSVWRDRPAMNTFVRTPPHRDAISKFAEWHDTGACFIDWESPDPVIDWKESADRLTQARPYGERP
ncbi:MAG: antibiotic biosynthesis monooxygenase [Thermoplasmata archaeon]|jgi:heme-degrading monooxygenase HmoA